jgi:ribonucleoside-diphosphate reductase alpha chain
VERAGGPRRRNATCLAIAPTGTLRLLAGCNGGMEPLLHPVLRVRTPEGVLRWCDHTVARWIEGRAGDPEAVLAALEAGVASQDLPGLDEAARSLLRPAWEVAPEDQLAAQAAFQEHVDGAVSKTVHLPAASSPGRIAELALRAHGLGCKGAAFYRRTGSGPPLEIDLTERVCIDCEPAPGRTAAC